MLIELAEWLQATFGDWKGVGLFQYISFRAGATMVLSLIISVAFGRRIIDMLRRHQAGETVRDLGLKGQKEKEGTPTMGGLIIILAIALPAMLMAKLDNVYFLLLLLSTLWMGVIGFIDDYIKVYKKNKEGLKGRFKLLGQLGLGLIISLTMLFSDQVVVRMSTADATNYHLENTQVGESFEVENYRGQKVEKGDYKTGITDLPFIKEYVIDYYNIISGKGGGAIGKILFVLLVIFIVMAVSNAANLTDGLDGLATGVSAIIGAALGVIAYLSGNAITADYLNILHLPGSSEVVIYAAAFLGATLGFLWHNSFPASIFMGDTGSLTLGGIIAAMAIVLRKEWLIPILCGVFVAENLSVVLQVAWFKYTKKKYGEGRRIFRMSPLHHHYQKGGMSEVKIVTRFWLVAILLAVITIITLKVR